MKTKITYKRHYLVTRTSMKTGASEPVGEYHLSPSRMARVLSKLNGNGWVYVAKERGAQ